MSAPLLSIVIPSFQQGTLLLGALKSIQQQTFKNLEIIIMDAGSNDNTSQVVESFLHLPIRFYSEPDKGIYDAMNKGIRHSLGSYLYFMGCDDRLASAGVLENVFADADSTKNHVIYGDVIFTDSGIRYNGEFTHFNLISRNICHQAIFVHKKVFEVLGEFDIQYKILADWEFNMRWFNTYWVKRKYIPVVIANYSNTGLSASATDELFLSNEVRLKNRYFPYVVRYLNSNLSKPLHYRLVKFMTFNRIKNIEKIVNFFK